MHYYWWNQWFVGIHFYVSVYSHIALVISNYYRYALSPSWDALLHPPLTDTLNTMLSNYRPWDYSHNNNYTPPHTTLAHHQIDELIRGTYQHARYIYIIYMRGTYICLNRGVPDHYTSIIPHMGDLLVP